MNALEILILLIEFITISKSQNKYLPTLPLGEYKCLWDTLKTCESIINHEYAFNIHLSKKTHNVTETLGNITFKIPLDNANNLDINLASWSLRGGWKENSIVYKVDDVCKNLKIVFGNFWFAWAKAFDFPTVNCPIPAGTYISKGLDMREFDDHNFPKVYFYGKYKVLAKIITKNNKIMGCVEGEIRLVRPWEVSMK